MAEHKHLFPQNTAKREDYKYGGPKTPVEFKTPTRDRVPHSKKLVEEISAAEADAALDVVDTPQKEKPAGVTLDFISDPPPGDVPDTTSRKEHGKARETRLDTSKLGKAETKPDEKELVDRTVNVNDIVGVAVQVIRNL